MFKQKQRSEPAISTLVGGDTRVHGDLEFSGGCLIEGYVQGNVKSAKDEDSTLNISEQGCVEGAVMVPTIFLNGTIKGDVRATRRIQLGSNARVVGNVQYHLIEMAVGAEVNGKLIHEAVTPAAETQQPETAGPAAETQQLETVAPAAENREPETVAPAAQTYEAEPVAEMAPLAQVQVKLAGD